MTNEWVYDDYFDDDDDDDDSFGIKTLMMVIDETKSRNDIKHGDFYGMIRQLDIRRSHNHDMGNVAYSHV